MLEVKNLSKRYGEKQALRSVSFSIQGREAVGFLGINGAGKTTTMNILTGYISASDGDVVIDGIDVLTDPLKAKTRIGYLPEQPPVYGDMRVDEYLNFIYQLKKVKKNKAIRQDREEYLQGIMELVGITDVSKRMIRNLSKGYKQRVGLAQALIGDPEILILDEPTVGLDPAQIIEIRQLIRDLAKTRTVLLSSHILSEVQAVCDRIIILHQGKIVADGRTEQLADQLSGQNKAIRQDREEYLQGIMELVGITDVSKRMIRNLSKGYKQRVGLAQALIGDPEILILDEPTVGLDPAQIIEIRQLIRDLAKTRTVLLSSHILSEVQAVCDRIIILHQGKIVADGRTEQLADQLSGHLQIELEIEGNERTVLETLRKIPQIGRVQSQGGIQYTVYLPDNCTDSSAVRRAIFKAISRTDCAILSMSRKNYSRRKTSSRL